MDTIFLDYQASTPLDPQVFAVMEPFFTTHHANPHSSDHILGWQSQQAIQEARIKVAQLLAVDSDEVVFTSGATESNNLAIKGLKKSLQASGKTTIVTSAIEHKCVLECCDYLEGEGFEVIRLQPTAEGIILPEMLEQAMNDSVGLVSIMLVNNEIGTIQPVRRLAAIAHEFGSLFHTDAAQAPLFHKVHPYAETLNDAYDDAFDLVSLSAHKIYGPKGIGALFVRREVKPLLEPIMHGGGQEAGLRSGTLPTGLCVGFGAAAEKLTLNGLDNNREHLQSLSQVFLSELETLVPDISVNGHRVLRHPGNLNVRFPGFDARDLLQALQPYIAASTGSACSTGVEEPSYVLTALGLSLKEASESVRFSFGVDQGQRVVLEAARFVGNTVVQRRTSFV